MAVVIFLRGINVGGHRTFRPSVLAHQLRNYSLLNIGAAGTFVACKPISRARLRSELLRRLPFKAEVIMCTGAELIAAAAGYPFKSESPNRNVIRFMSLLARTPRRLSPSLPVRVPATGKWVVKIISRESRFLFGFYRREMRAIGCLGEIDKLFGVPATTRSWNTIKAIIGLLENWKQLP